MKAAIFNPYLDTLGGGERYCIGVIQSFLNAGYSVDVEWRDQAIIEKLQERFGKKLGGVRLVANINRGDGYDACFWVSDGSIPGLRARNNILHFQVPFKSVGGKTLINRMKFFRIKHVVCNSQFTKSVIDREFGVNSKVVYPPVSVHEFKPHRKKNLILYVGRFSDLAQKKRQDVLIEVFGRFHKKNSDWRMVLAGGAEVGGGSFLAKLEKKAKGLPVEIVKSPSLKKLKALYGEAKIFWSAAGYGASEEDSPKEVEHFGITVVEAMAAKAVPFAANKGGYKEIIKHGKTGFLWNKKSELLKLTLDFVENHRTQRDMAKAANEASVEFSEEEFEKSFTRLIS